MTDDIERAIVDALSGMETITGYACRECGEIFASGRNARQHLSEEHESHRGLKRLTERER
jgi:hypothetical protein